MLQAFELGLDRKARDPRPVVVERMAAILLRGSIGPVHAGSLPPTKTVDRVDRLDCGDSNPHNGRRIVNCRLPIGCLPWAARQPGDRTGGRGYWPALELSGRCFVVWLMLSDLSERHIVLLQLVRESDPQFGLGV
jgi:hypothetical protein